MAAMFIQLVKKMVIFLVVGQTILHFGIGRQYERYVKLLISLMVAAQLVAAASGLFAAFAEGFTGLAKGMGYSPVESSWEKEMEAFEKAMEGKQSELNARLEERTGEILQEADYRQEEEQQERNQIRVEEIRIQ